MNHTIFAAFMIPNSIFKRPNQLPSLRMNATIYPIQNNFNYNLKNIADGLDSLSIKELCIITITRRFDDDIVKNIYKGSNCTIYNYTVSNPLFFSNYGISKFLFENFQDEDIKILNELPNTTLSSNFIIFKFEDTTWISIKKRFKSYGLVISGKECTLRKYVYSPTNLKLGLFICWINKLEHINISEYYKSVDIANTIRDINNPPYI